MHENKKKHLWTQKYIVNLIFNPEVELSSLTVKLLFF